MQTPSNHRLVAHRGYMEHYPENSWTGIQTAIAQGAKWIECDIQMYSPGHFILSHDADLERTAGTALSVFDLSEPQLQTISIHEPSRLGERHSPEPILLLETLLRRIADHPQLRVMIEIKEESLDHWGVEEVMQPLLRLLQPHRPQCVLISFSFMALQYARAHSDLELGWVLREYNQASLARARVLEPEFVICNYLRMPQGARPNGEPWRWMIYDITEPEMAQQWLNWGFDLIETRDIGTLIKHPLLTGT